jgi:hypothetical protein
VAVVWLIVKILLIVLGVLLAALVAACLCSITVRVEQEEELKVRVHYLFLHRQLLPEPQESEGSEDAEEEPEGDLFSLNQKAGHGWRQFADRLKQSLKRNIRGLDFGTVVELALEAICDVFDPTKKILSHVRMLDLCMDLRVGAPDAAQTAIRYGQVSAAFYNVLALLQRYMTVKVKRVRIDIDYLSGQTNAQYSFVLKLRMGVAAWQLLRAGIGLMKTKNKLEAAQERAAHRKEESYGSSN